MTDRTEIFSGLYLPVANRFLLVPNVSVAEIVDYHAPETPENAPEWYLGKIEWRGLRIPLVSYPAANGENIDTVDTRVRVAIINAISEYHEQQPFYAIITQGIPRQIKIDSKSIEELPSESLGKAELMKVKVLGDEAVIPNMEYLEKLASQQTV
jgi:chemosensory pili system protein ChpC